MVMSSSSGVRSDQKVSGVPQSGQNVRVPCSEERKLAGSPLATRNAVLGTVAQATKGAPLVRLQMEQWQFVSFETGPSTW
jgi:hypothetical protein